MDHTDDELANCGELIKDLTEPDYKAITNKLLILYKSDSRFAAWSSTVHDEMMAEIQYCIGGEQDEERRSARAAFDQAFTRFNEQIANNSQNEPGVLDSMKSLGTHIKSLREISDLWIEDPVHAINKQASSA